MTTDEAIETKRETARRLLMILAGTAALDAMPRGLIHDRPAPRRLRRPAEHNNGDPLRRKARPRRNEPCHCGSGKKYKTCCMTK